MLRNVVLATIGAVGITACVSTPKSNPILDDARAAVQSAEADPNVSTYDPLDLQAAQKDLATAEAASVQHHDAEVNQPADMAGQMARVAQAKASAKADDARVAAGQAQRDQIRLAARERDAQAALAAKQAADQNAQAADAKASQLQAEIDAMKANQTARGLVLTLGDVLFATGRSELNSGAARKMNQLAQFLSEHPDRRVEIDGFTDSVGTDAYNEQLSQNRAASVKSALVGMGVDPSRISIQGYGKSFPVAGNDDAAGRQMNRRVEVVIGGANNMAIAPRS